MKKKYKIMLLTSDKLVTTNWLSANGVTAKFTFKEHYDSAKEAERDIYRAVKVLPPSSIEYVIVPTYWYDPKC